MRVTLSFRSKSRAASSAAFSIAFGVANSQGELFAFLQAEFLQAVTQPFKRPVYGPRQAE